MGHRYGALGCEVRAAERSSTVRAPGRKDVRDDLDARVERLREQGVRMRNEIVDGVGGRQILIEDPSGNPVELFEPTIPEARL